jgi:hypothetical protein
MGRRDDGESMPHREEGASNEPEKSEGSEAGKEEAERHRGARKSFQYRALLLLREDGLALLFG